MLLGSRNSMTLSERLLWLDVDTGSEKFNMAATKSEIPVSQLVYKIAKKFERLPHFSGSGNSVVQSKRLHLTNGSKKFKMAAAKPEVPVFQLPCKIPKKFERLPHVFGVGKVNSAIKKARCRNLRRQI